MKYLSKQLLLGLTFSILLVTYSHAQTGTANGNYNFASISTTSNSHSTGFKTQQDKLAVNNGAATYPLATPYSGYQNSMYDAANTTSTATGNITIKAEGGSVCKTFTLKNINFYIYNSGNQSRSLKTMTVTIKNNSGTTIATHTFSGTYNTTNAQTLFSLTNIPFSFPFPSTGYTDVSEINFTYTCGNGAAGYSPSNLFFRSIDLEDISASLSPTITTTGTLNAFSTCSGTASAAQSFTVGGTNLTNNIVVSAPTGYEVSTVSASGYGSSVTLTQSGGTVASTTIYTRIASTATGSPSGNITVVSTGATTQNIAVSGTVNPLPNISISIAEATGATNNDGIVCSGSSATLTVVGLDGSSTVLWTGNATTNSITVTPIVATIYTVTVTNANGCKNTASANIRLEPLPSGSVSVVETSGNRNNDGIICSGASVQLTASGIDAASSFFWSTGQLTNTISYNPTITTTYTLTVTNNTTGCVTSIPKRITVNSVPTITLSSVADIATTATSFSLPYSATTGSPNQYSISTGTPTAMSGFTAVNNATLPASPISVIIPASAASTYNFNAIVTNSTTGCVSSAVPFTVTVAAPAPSINTSGVLNAFSTCSGTASTAQSFTVGGTNLTNNIVVSAPTGYEVSTASASGYGSSVTLTQSGGTVASTTIYTRLASTATGSPSGNITVVSTGATTQNIAVSGTVNSLPSITLGSVSSVLTTSTSFSLPYTATTGSPNQYSITAGTPTGMSGFTAVSNATLPASPIIVTIPASAAGTYNFNLSLVNTLTGCASSNNPFTVTVAAPASATVTATGTLNGFSTCSGTASAAQSFTVGGSNLTNNITVTAPTGYEVSLASGSGYSSSITLTQSSGSVATTTIYTRLSATATGSPSGNITVASTGATTQNVAVSGTVNALPNTSITVVESSGTTNNDGNICNGSSVTLSVAGLDGSSTVLWSTGAITNAITVSPASTTTYTAIVTNANGCTKTSSVTITVNALPSGSVSVVESSGSAGNDGIICSGATVQLIASGIDASSSFFWSTGQLTNTISYSLTGTQTFTLTVTNNTSGCVLSVPKTITVNSAPTITLGAVSSVLPTATSFSLPYTATTGSPTSYGIVAAAPNAMSGFATVNSTTLVSSPINVAIPASAPGTYNFNLRVVNAASCFSSFVPFTVTVGSSAAVTATGTLNGFSTCSGSASTAQSFAVGGTGLTNDVMITAPTGYEVSLASGSGYSSSITLTQSSGSVATTTIYTRLSATATGSPSGNITVASTGATTQNVAVSGTVNALPNTSITVVESSGTTNNDGNICNGSSVTLNVAGLDGTSTVLWSTGAITNAITVSPASTTTYTAIVTNANGCNKTSSVTITVNSLPNTSIAIAETSGATNNDGVICNGSSVQLSASGLDGSSSVAWSTGAITNAITVSPVSTTTYSLYTTNANGCTKTSGVTITVNPLPVASISAGGATTFCQGGSVTLTASTGSSYLWSTGATTASINVSTSGNYTVTVTNANGCSATSAATTVTVNPLPTASISAGSATTFCQGGSVTLTASTGTSYLWSTGATTASINVSTGSNYTVTVTNANGCSATSAATTVTVNPLPTASISAGGATTFCQGDSVTLTASAGASYLWSTGATTASINVSTGGNYSVTVTNASGCSATSAATTVTVNPLPTASISAGGATIFCQGSSVTLTASTGTNYLWSTGATTASINVSTSGNYTVTVTNANGCSATSTATTVTVNPLPTASISAGSATTFCQGGSVTLTATTGTSYLWSTGATTASINVSTSGNYTVRVTNASGCSATSAATTVTVNPLPMANISAASTVICGAGNSTNLTATGGATYQWSRNGTPISGATSSAYAATIIGTYTATATSAFGCTAPATGSLVVTQLLAPKASFTYDSYCTNKAINFTNTSTVNTTGAVSYTWSDNNANTSNATNARFTYANAGSYSVKLKVQSNTCSNLADSVTVVVPVEAPRAAIRQTTLDVAINDNVQLQARNFGNQYAWSPSLGLSDPFISNPTINTSKEQEYLITIGVPSGCTTVDTLKVRIHESNKIYVPNVFTPNGDGQNDKLYLIPVGISELKSYRIFNRWGKKLFETSSISQGWDGTFNGQLQPLDTYVWTVLAVDKNGNTIHQEGTVTLLR